MATRVTYVLASTIVALAASTHVARAQQPTRVQGLVTNDTRQPLAGVSVGIPSLGVGAFTGDAGRYTFTIPADRASGQVSLTARRIGFQPVTASINLSAGTITKDFVLASSPTQLEGVVVTALELASFAKLEMPPPDDGRPILSATVQPIRSSVDRWPVTPRFTIPWPKEPARLPLMVLPITTSRWPELP